MAYSTAFIDLVIKHSASKTGMATRLFCHNIHLPLFQTFLTSPNDVWLRSSAIELHPNIKQHFAIINDVNFLIYSNNVLIKKLKMGE